MLMQASLFSLILLKNKLTSINFTYSTFSLDAVLTTKITLFVFQLVVYFTCTFARIFSLMLYT